MCLTALWWFRRPQRHLWPYEIEGTVVDERTAPLLYPALQQGTRKLFDPVALLVNRPDFVALVPWPEHPLGAIRFATNNRGFREDEPTEVSSEAYRILVLGDSHTEGAVNNDESYPNVLELQLNKRSERPVEVINAGVGGTGPYEMEGMLVSQLELEPDLVIATLFTGNDFWNALMISDFYTKRRQRSRTPEYGGMIVKARDSWPVVFAQGFNQAFLFDYDPQSARVALDVTVERFAVMNDLCAREGIGFLAMILPTKVDVDGDDDAATINGVLDALALSRQDYSINAQLAHRFGEALAERGIRCVDLTPRLAAFDEPFYWHADHHLNVAGHALVAHTLLPIVGEFLRASDADDQDDG